MTLTDPHLTELRMAKRSLENPGVAMKLTQVLGAPLERGLDYLPEAVQDGLAEVTQSALKTALDVALRTFSDTRQRPAALWQHKVAAAASGALAAGGLPALTIELPLSTTIMLRSIADIARAEGRDMTDPGTALECLSVFAMGGSGGNTDAVDSGYYAVRIALARTLGQAAEFIAVHGLSKDAAPIIVRLLSLVAKRFGVAVGEKAAAQAVPIVGGITGATINTLFMDHFQSMARAHFTIRRLDDVYGVDVIQAAYLELDEVEEPTGP